MPPENYQEDTKAERLAGVFSSSMLWNVANTGASQVITMVVFIFLTYQLDPVVFGVFALGVVLVDYFNFQAHSSAIDAVFQRRQFDSTAWNTAFWTMLACFTLATIVLAFSGSMLAMTTDEPRLTYVMPALALTLLPLPFSVAPMVMLTRAHDFKGTALRNIIAVFAGGIVAAAIALSPYPEWALVGQRMANVTTSSIFLMLRARWFPSLEFQVSYAWQILKDASRIFFAQGVAATTLRILDVLIAIVFSTAAVGFMRVASRLTQVVYGAFAAPAGAVSLLLLTGDEHHDGKDKQTLYLRLSHMLAFICLPIFSGIALTSAEITEILLDDSYAPVGPLLAILCVAGLFTPFTYLRNATFTAMRHLNRLLIYSVIDVLVLIIAAILLSRISLPAAVGSLIIVQLVRAVLTLPFLLRHMHCSFDSLIKTVSPAYIAIILMAGDVLAMSIVLGNAPALLALGVKAATGAGIYLGYLWLFHRQWLFDGFKMVRPQNGRKGIAPETA